MTATITLTVPVLTAANLCSITDLLANAAAVEAPGAEPALRDMARSLRTALGMFGWQQQPDGTWAR